LADGAHVLVPVQRLARATAVPPPGSLAARLFKEGYAFSFFQSVRLLEQVYPDRQPVGHDAAPLTEVARFRANVSMSFPPSQINTLNAPAAFDQPPTMVVNFFGLTGPSGILPRHYTELLLRLYRDAKGPERTSLRDWLDLFNHRLISLFYRAWTKYHFFIPFQRREFEKREPDSFTQAIYSIAGMGMPSLRSRLRVCYWDADNPEQPERVLAQINDLTLLFYSGLLSTRPRNAVALEALIEDYFQVPVQVKQFHGQWLQLDRSNQSAAGEGEANNGLGINAIAGERVWDVLGRIRLRVGPLRLSEFTSFIPDRSATRERKAFFLLVHLVRLFVGPELSFDVQMVLRADEVPECRLEESEDAVGARLGWNTWLVSQEAEQDAGDAVFEGEEIFWINDEERRAALAAAGKVA
jgi:type VI secretion system protein ImpH